MAFPSLREQLEVSLSDGDTKNQCIFDNHTSQYDTQFSQTPYLSLVVNCPLPVGETHIASAIEIAYQGTDLAV